MKMQVNVSGCCTDSVYESDSDSGLGSITLMVCISICCLFSAFYWGKSGAGRRGRQAVDHALHKQQCSKNVITLSTRSTLTRFKHGACSTLWLFDYLTVWLLLPLLLSIFRVSFSAWHARWLRKRKTVVDRFPFLFHVHFHFQFHFHDFV